MKTIAIIPARGGSKGIPGKNIKKILEKPLIAYSIESALMSKSIDRVVVSTDDEKIADVAVACGAEIIIRPDDISGDLASSESALIHALDYLREKESYHPDILVFIQCTSPLVLPVDIDGTVQALIDYEADSSFSAARFYHFIWERDQNGEMAGINHDKRTRPMRQQRQEQFQETGAVYVMRVVGFLQHRHRFFGKTVMHEMPAERCIEIDEPVDLLLAERLLELQQNEHRLL